MTETSGRKRVIYFEDIEEGIQPESPEIKVNGQDMLEYNRKYDPWPLHVDESAARESPFEGIIASGGYTISLAYLLSHRIYNTGEAEWAFLGGLNSRLNFPAPVYAGDTLRYTLEVTGKRPSRLSGRGIVKIFETLTNQNNDVAFTAESVILVATRSTAP